MEVRDIGTPNLIRMSLQIRFGLTECPMRCNQAVILGTP
jgi:hypothetical protein